MANTINIKHGSLYVKTESGWVQISLGANVNDIIGLEAALDNKIQISTFLTDPDPTKGIIKKEYIPNEILAGVTYGGTCIVNINDTANATLSKEAQYLLNTTDTSRTLNTNDYATYGGLFFVVATTSNQSFAGKDFNTGDWLLATADSWEKIDNTDLVSSVNSRKGAVNIYQDSFDSANNYYKGDVVSHNSDLYLCIKNTSNSIQITNTDYWRSFGKDWTSNINDLAGQVNNLVTTAQALPTYVVSENEPSSSGNYQIGSIWIQTTTTGE